MAGTSLALSLTGALGLILLGAWMSTEGMRYVAGGAWRELLLSSKRKPLAALRAGMAASILVPSTHTLAGGSIAAGASGSLGVRAAMLLGMGVSFAAVAGAGWAVLFSLTDAGHLPGFVLLCLAAVASRLPKSRRPAGARELLGGLGLAVLGMDELAGVTTALGEFGRLDAWNVSLLVRLAGCLGLGICAAWGLHTASGAVAVGVLFGAGGLLDPSSTGAFVLGAFAGGSIATIKKLRSNEADERRVALGLATHHLVCVACGVLLLPWILPVARSGARGLEVAAPALLLLAAVVVGTTVMAYASGPLSRLLDRWFVDIEDGVGRSTEIDPCLWVFPDLMLEGGRQRLARLAILVRVIARTVLSGGRITDRRLETDLESIHQLDRGLLALVETTKKARMNEHVSGELPELRRASEALCRVSECAREIRAQKLEGPEGEARVGGPLANRMRQLEMLYLHLVEGCAQATASQPLGLSEEELASVQAHTQDLSNKVLEACQQHQAPAALVANLLARLNCLDRMGSAALEAAESLSTTHFPPITESSQQASDGLQGEGVEPSHTSSWGTQSTGFATDTTTTARRVPTADLHGWPETPPAVPDAGGPIGLTGLTGLTGFTGTEGHRDGAPSQVVQ
jgi:Na+/phosphate symporter